MDRDGEEATGKLETVLRVVRYVVMGLRFAAGAPWLFVKLGLAQADKSS